jgi:hypothetical protein
LRFAEVVVLILIFSVVCFRRRLVLVLLVLVLLVLVLLLLFLFGFSLVGWLVVWVVDRPPRSVRLITEIMAD